LSGAGVARGHEVGEGKTSAVAPECVGEQLGVAQRWVKWWWGVLAACRRRGRGLTLPSRTPTSLVATAGGVSGADGGGGRARGALVAADRRVAAEEGEAGTRRLEESQRPSEGRGWCTQRRLRHQRGEALELHGPRSASRGGVVADTRPGRRPFVRGFQRRACLVGRARRGGGEAPPAQNGDSRNRRAEDGPR
jgi:hypothetical protein